MSSTELMAVPRAITGVDIAQEDVGAAMAHIAKYYAKMGEKPPWEKG